MSSIICSEETFNTIYSAYEALRYEYIRKEHLDYHKMVQNNLLAVEVGGLYNKITTLKEIRKNFVYEKVYFTNMAAYKKIQFYLKQCSDGGRSHTKTYNTVRELGNHLAYLILAKTEEWDETTWE